MAIKFLRNTLFGVCYITLSLIIGEVHPFTLVPMYNNFPNWAYAFYASDDEGSLLPNNSYFKINSADLAHKYYTICQNNNIRYGDRIETDQELNLVGRLMLNELLDSKANNSFFDKVNIHRVCYFYENDSVNSQDIIMYGSELK